MTGGSEFEVLFTHFTLTTEYVLLIVGSILCLILMRMIIARYKIDFLPESALIIIFGIVCGLIAWFSSKTDRHNLMSFDYEIFFLIFIPPIILEAGYFLHKDFFFHNLRLIIIYAVIGTILNSFFTGLSLYLFRSFFPIEMSLVESLAFGSLISAVDPVAVLAIFEEAQVNETLHIIVSGESILNDSVSIVLFQLFVNLTKVPHITTNIPFLAIVRFFLVSLGGVLFGVFMGLFGSWLTKFTNVLQLFEPLVLMCVGFLSYQFAEVLSLSGIVSILFCGIILSRYADTNMGRRSSLTFKRDLKSFASMNEAIIFLYLGFEMTFQFASKDPNNNQPTHDFSLLFTCLTLFFILFYRFVIIFILTNIANRSRITKVKLKEQLILSYSGLRGAIAFALAFSLPDSIKAKNCFISTTLIVICFTVFIQGGTIKPIMKKLHLKFAKKGSDDPQCSNQILPIVFLHVQNAMFSIIGGNGGSYNWSHKWHDLDHFLQQFFVRGLFQEEKDFLTVLNQLKEAEVKVELDEREKRRLLVDQAKFSRLVQNPNVRLERVMQEKNRRLTDNVEFPPSQRQNRLRKPRQLSRTFSDQSSQTDFSSQSEFTDLDYNNNFDNSTSKGKPYLTEKMQRSKKRKRRKKKGKKSLYKNHLTVKRSDPLFSSFGSQTDLELRSKFSRKDLSKVVCKLQNEHNLSNLNRLVPYSRVNEPRHQYDLDVNTLPVLVRRGHLLKQNLTTNVLGNVRRHKHLSHHDNHNKIHRHGYKAINYNYKLSNNVSKHMMPTHGFNSIKKLSSSSNLNSFDQNLSENELSENNNQKVNTKKKIAVKKNQINLDLDTLHQSDHHHKHHYKHHHKHHKHHHKHHHRPHTSHRLTPSIEIQRFRKINEMKKEKDNHKNNLIKENYNINKDEIQPFLKKNRKKNSLDERIIDEKIPKHEKNRKLKGFKKKKSQGFEIEIESPEIELEDLLNSKTIPQEYENFKNQQILDSSNSSSEN
ncbi:sodium/hydrogen exchanger [Anaeramoeba flamelloides]|uniref:Sodium/hydrogen exchanger n=1 Tax=Anaeramoeba flamelloides TaxID=1746091 RepID=A0AAV7YS38_9EUKA|nr:sodium/hydrogen exchanger [Anaeramoeba flamelloides]KAJ6242034.1 sodium/hydrogen exchanger [Anaeramoeba flamelloides]